MFRFDELLTMTTVGVMQAALCGSDAGSSAAALSSSPLLGVRLGPPTAVKMQPIVNKPLTPDHFTITGSLLYSDSLYVRSTRLHFNNFCDGELFIKSF